MIDSRVLLPFLFPSSHPVNLLSNGNSTHTTVERADGGERQRDRSHRTILCQYSNPTDHLPSSAFCSLTYSKYLANTVSTMPFFLASRLCSLAHGVETLHATKLVSTTIVSCSLLVSVTSFLDF